MIAYEKEEPPDFADHMHLYLSCGQNQFDANKNTKKTILHMLNTLIKNFPRDAFLLLFEA